MLHNTKGLVAKYQAVVTDVLNRMKHDYYDYVADIHGHGIRDRMKLHLKRARTVTGAKTVKIKGAQLYNLLPDETVTSQTLAGFTKKVKSKYLESYCCEECD